MCKYCWIHDHGMPVAASTEVLAVAHLIESLYRMPGCSTGGPLHWMLDDMNIGDDQMGDDNPVEYWQGLFAYLHDGRFERVVREGDDTGEVTKLAIQVTCEAIVLAFREMTEPVRASCIAWAFGWVAERVPQWSSRHIHPDQQAEYAAHAETLLARARELPLIDQRGETVLESKACVSVPCPPFREVSFGERYAPLFADGPMVQLADVPEELRPLAEQLIQEHGPRIIRDGDGIVVEQGGLEWAAGRFSGVVAAPEGARFAPDAKIIGPFAQFTRVGDDGLLHLDGVPLAGSVVEGSPEIKWAQFYGPDADGNYVSRSWTAEDIVRATAQPDVSVADVLDDPRQIKPHYPESTD